MVVDPSWGLKRLIHLMVDGGGVDCKRIEDCGLALNATKDIQMRDFL